MESQIEFPLFTSNEGQVFKIPPASSSRGHRAEDWRGQCVWKGKIEIKSTIHHHKINDAKCIVTLSNLTDGQIFGKGYVNYDYEKQIERCYDSSRYFAIKLYDEKKNLAQLGIGFPDRNIAFDFINSFQKFQNEVKVDSDPTTIKTKNLQQDLSIKPDQQIVLNLNMSNPPSAVPTSSGGLGKLKPPPKAKKTAAQMEVQKKAISKPTVETTTTQQNSQLPFAEFYQSDPPPSITQNTAKEEVDKNITDQNIANLLDFEF